MATQAVGETASLRHGYRSLPDSSASVEHSVVGSR